MILNWTSKVLPGIAVLAAHVAAWCGMSFFDYAPSAARPPEIMVMTAEILQLREARDKVPAPDLQLAVPARPDINAPQDIQFDDSIEDDLAAIIAPASAPHLARVQTADPTAFALRAHLPPGRPTTVILRLEVTPEGSVGSADVVSTSNNAAADAAAVDYALELRWVPGTVDRKPVRMRIRFPVTLVARRAT